MSDRNGRVIQVGNSLVIVDSHGSVGKTQYKVVEQLGDPETGDILIQCQCNNGIERPVLFSRLTALWANQYYQIIEEA